MQCVQLVWYIYRQAEVPFSSSLAFTDDSRQDPWVRRPPWWQRPVEVYTNGQLWLGWNRLSGYFALFLINKSPYFFPHLLDRDIDEEVIVKVIQVFPRFEREKKHHITTSATLSLEDNVCDLLLLWKYICRRTGSIYTNVSPVSFCLLLKYICLMVLEAYTLAHHKRMPYPTTP